MLLAAAACGGDDEQSASQQWVDSLCTSVTTWQGAVASTVGDLASGEKGVNQQALEATAADVRTATQTLVDDLRALGPPDTEAGQEAQAKTKELANELEQDMQKAAADARANTDLRTKLSNVAADLEAAVTQVRTTLGEISSLDSGGELATAFQNSDACAPLR